MQKPEYVRTRRRLTPLFGASMLAYGINILFSAVVGDWTEALGWVAAAIFNTLWALEK